MVGEDEGDVHQRKVAQVVHAEVTQAPLEVHRRWVERGRLVVTDGAHLFLDRVDSEDLGVQTRGERGVDDSGIA